MSKKRDKSKKRRRERAEPSGAAAMMDADDPIPDAVLDPHGAAAIAPVTDEMMRHAAQGAAELADGVAHGTAHLTQVAQEAVAETAAAGQSVLEQGARDAASSASSGVASAEAAAGALGQYGNKLVDVLRANVEAAGAHAAALAQAKSLPEAAAINADHVRRQLEALISQGRELSVLAQRALFEALQPFKGVLPRD